MHYANLNKDADYSSRDIKVVNKEQEKRDDSQSVQTTIIRLNKTGDYRPLLRQSGPQIVCKSP